MPFFVACLSIYYLGALLLSFTVVLLYNFFSNAKDENIVLIIGIQLKAEGNHGGQSRDLLAEVGPGRIQTHPKKMRVALLSAACIRHGNKQKLREFGATARKLLEMAG